MKQSLGSVRDGDIAHLDTKELNPGDKDAVVLGVHPV